MKHISQIERVNPQWADTLERTHIIAAVRDSGGLAEAAVSPTATIYLLFGTTLNIGDMLKTMRDHGKLPFVNLDLLTGFSRDPVNAEFLDRCGAGGIVSTHMEVLRAARKRGLITVQRTFALDSVAVEAGLRVTSQFLPDAIEILPAVAAPRLVSRFRKVHPTLRILAGGLVSDMKEAESLLAAGIDAVSVSDARFWVC